MAAIEAELAKAGDKDKPKREPRLGKELGAHRERVEIVIEPELIKQGERIFAYEAP